MTAGQTATQGDPAVPRAAVLTPLGPWGGTNESAGQRDLVDVLTALHGGTIAAPRHRCDGAPRPSLPDAATDPSADQPAAATVRRPLSQLVDPGWAAVLDPVADQVTAMGDFLRGEIAAGRDYLPAGANVLRAFTLPFDAVRVLIVGQDPYPTPGHPVGLSFSVAPTVRPLPRSLLNIFREYGTDLDLPDPATGDLSPWSEHGVMLLNRVLTVQPGRPGSHRGKGWEQITDTAVWALAARAGPLVAVLWGRDAQTLRPLLGEIPVVTSAHPSPMSADRGFFGSRPFSRANQLLVEQGGDPVDWRLPA